MDQATRAIARQRGRNLDPHELVRTIETLRDRLSERFPGSGLSRLADDMAQIATVTISRIAWVVTPNLPLRIGVGALIVVILGLIGGLVVQVRGGISIENNGFADLLETLESLMNDIFLIGASIFFLVTVESRIKRHRALAFLRELRALAHIIDMHQLTKDPHLHLNELERSSDPAARIMSRDDLTRYLDYCSDMLALLGKVAALYAQNSDDAVVLAAVDEVEALTTGLSSRIWQKITILERV